MVLGAYSSAPNLKTTKALPPPPPGSKKQTRYKNYWCNPTWQQFFCGGKTQITTVAQIEISD